MKYILAIVALICFCSVAQAQQFEPEPEPPVFLPCYTTNTTFCHQELPNSPSSTCANSSCAERTTTINGENHTVMVCNAASMTYVPQGVSVKKHKPAAVGLSGVGNYGSVNCLYKDTCSCNSTAKVGAACHAAAQSFPPNGKINTSEAAGNNCPDGNGNGNGGTVGTNTTELAT